MKNQEFNTRDPLSCASLFSRRKELTAEARELKGELYCLPCHDKMGVPICGACRRPIEGRVVNAMGKQWHVEVRQGWDLSMLELQFYTLCIFKVLSSMHVVLRPTLTIFLIIWSSSWIDSLKFTLQIMTIFTVFIIWFFLIIWFNKDNNSFP